MKLFGWKKKNTQTKDNPSDIELRLARRVLILKDKLAVNKKSFQEFIELTNLTAAQLNRVIIAILVKNEGSIILTNDILTSVNTKFKDTTFDVVEIKDTPGDFEIKLIDSSEKEKVNNDEQHIDS